MFMGFSGLIAHPKSPNYLLFPPDGDGMLLVWYWLEVCMRDELLKITSKGGGV
jgi:hypothetical protein